MRQLLRIGNIVAIDPLVGFGEVVITAVAVDQRLDLLVGELRVGEDREVRGKGAKDTIAAELGDAVVVVIHGLHEIVDVGLVLGRGWLEGFGDLVMVTYGGERHGGYCEEAEQDRKPKGWLEEHLHD